MVEPRKKRLWRNLVLDREYQLMFTLLLVGACAVFMTGLGYFVLRDANTATKTAIQDVQGQALIDPEVGREIVADLESRKLILEVLLVGLGAGLCGGLFVYGIKMTHKVAGPLYKVGLYCDRVAAGRFERVTPLRRGDQLVEFYEHFKQAHEAVRRREEADVATLRAVVAAADDAELAARSPEIATRLEDLRTILARKEASLG
jgi:hypothetical protein